MAREPYIHSLIWEPFDLCKTFFPEPFFATAPGRARKFLVLQSSQPFPLTLACAVPSTWKLQKRSSLETCILDLFNTFKTRTKLPRLIRAICQMIIFKTASLTHSLVNLTFTLILNKTKQFVVLKCIYCRISLAPKHLLWFLKTKSICLKWVALIWLHLINKLNGLGFCLRLFIYLRHWRSLFQMWVAKSHNCNRNNLLCKKKL